MAAEKSKPVIGLTWEPKLPSLRDSKNPLSASSAAASSSSSSTSNNPEKGVLYKSSSELIDGLFVPPNDPRKLNKMLRKQIKDTAGRNWFEMPAPVITPELKQDLQLLKLRAVMDPKRHYKKTDLKSKTLPKYFQVGTVIEPATEYYSARMTKKERKATIADELLTDASLTAYRKRKVQELDEQNRPTTKDKWKIRGKQTLKRAKQRRHLR